jgi:hypothetical protein
MPVTFKELDGLRAQLAADRKLCGSDQTAQQFLDVAETKLADVEAGYARRNPIEVLDAILGEAEIGSDTTNSEELRAKVRDLTEWSEALEEIPAECRTLPLYALAERYLRTLKQNYVALYLKHEAETLPAPENSTVN